MPRGVRRKLRTLFAACGLTIDPMTRPQIGMRCLSVTAAALFTLTSTGCALARSGVSTTSTQTEQEIRQLEGRLREAALSGATAVLDDILADDYTNTDAYGLVRHKAQVIADIASGDSSFETIFLDDISVNLYGDAAVLTAKRTVRGRTAGRDPSGQFRQIRVYAKRQGRWQAVMLQVTRIAVT